MTSNEHDTLTRRDTLLRGSALGIGALGVSAVASGRGALAQDATPAAGGATTMIPALTSDGALAAMQAALAKAHEIGVPEVVAVVDAAGNLLAFSRMDGTPTTSIELAMDKAFTAASFRSPTDQFGQAVAADASVMASLLKAPRITLLPGGIPLMAGQAVVGAIGCSGGSGDQDVQCAEAGVAAIASKSN